MARRVYGMDAIRRARQREHIKSYYAAKREEKYQALLSAVRALQKALEEFEQADARTHFPVEES